MRVRDEAAAIAGDIAELRHAIHREPEIGLDLPETQRKVLAALDGLPLELRTGRGLAPGRSAAPRGSPSSAASTFRSVPGTSRPIRGSRWIAWRSSAIRPR